MAGDIAARLGNVLIVGGGNMGRAICAGIVRIDGFDPASIVVANPGAGKRAAIEEAYGVRTVARAAEGLPADTVVLAVKPAKVPEVASGLASAGFDAGTLVSVAAGVSTASLASVFGPGVSVVRVMPNTPLVCGQGMSAVSPGAGASDESVALVRDLFACMGKAVVVDEDKQDVVTALSGSGPAYFELVAQTLARAAEELGIDYDIARELAVQTMLGTAVLVDETSADLDEAIAAVSSPGGTTVAALQAMRADGIEVALRHGVRAAARRSAELGA